MLRISTDDVPERQRLEFWREKLTEAIGVAPCFPAGASEPFVASLTGRSSGPLHNLQFAADGHPVQRDRRNINRRHWDSYWIYRENSPGAWFEFADREIVTRTGDLIVADADAAFKSFPAARYMHELWIVPKARLDPYLPSRRVPVLMGLSGRVGVDALAGSFLESVSREWDSLPEPSMHAVADTLCRLVGIACGTAADAQPDAVREARLAEARRHIDRHIASPRVSPANVAAALGISVRALHLVFEPTGISFGRYVMQRRLEECRSSLLANPTRPVLDIALAWGFSSVSSFYRAFQAHFGLTPGDLRAMALRNQDST